MNKSLYPVYLHGQHETWKRMLAKYQKFFGSLSLILTLLLGSQSVYAKNVKCWENNDGVRECGNVVPPEFSKNRIEIVNEYGVVVDVIQAAKTREELAAERQRERERRAREAAEAEQRRLDDILLSTYSREEDIIKTRENNVAAIDCTIDIAKANLKIWKAVSMSCLIVQPTMSAQANSHLRELKRTLPKSN